MTWRSTAEAAIQLREKLTQKCRYALFRPGARSTGLDVFFLVGGRVAVGLFFRVTVCLEVLGGLLRSGGGLLESVGDTGRLKSGDGLLGSVGTWRSAW